MVDEDAHQCKYCTDLCFLSMAMCKEHTLPSQESTPATEASQVVMTKQEKRAKMVSQSTESHQFCIQHLNVCGCTMDNFLVVYRYRTEELQEYMTMINNFCIQEDRVPKIPKLKPNFVSFNYNPATEKF